MQMQISRPTRLEELKEIIRRTILVRRVTLGVFFALALPVRLALGVDFPLALLFVPLIWLGMTYPFKALIEAQRSESGLHWVHAGFFIVELALITWLIHFLQGVEWIGLIFYLFTVIYANFFLPQVQGYLITGLAVIFYAALVLLEWAGLIPHRALFAHADHRSLSYVLTTILAGGVGIYATLAYTIRIFAEIYRQKGRELERLSVRLLTAQEEERRRLARQLHDELGQTLTAAKLSLGMATQAAHAQAQVQPQAQELKERLVETGQLLDRAIEETRALSHRLRPPLLDELGLVPALRWLVERFTGAEGLQVELEADEGEVGRLGPELEGLLYRAAQEALTNVVRHARATRARVELTRAEGRVRLTVEDDGQGFDVGRALRRGEGLGLQGLRERAALAGGTLRISSRPGTGTRLTLEVPLDGEEEGGAR